MDIKDIVQLLKQRQLELAIELAEHPAKSFEEYRERVGMHKGVCDSLDRLISADVDTEDD